MRARDPLIPTQNPRHYWHPTKLILHPARAFILISMSETLKRQFYAACPVWYWPVLWWQFVIMARYLSRLYAETGRAEMTYGLALGPRGQLHLIYLSNAAREYAEGRVIQPPAYHTLCPVRLECPKAEYVQRNTRTGEGARHNSPQSAIAPLTKLYIDPG